MLAIAAQFFTTPGPTAAKTAADYLVHHLCVWPPIRCDAMGQLARELYLEQEGTSHILFEGGWWQSSALLQLDLILQGVTSCRSLLGALWTILVRNEQPVLELDVGLLPDHHTRAEGGVRCLHA